MTSHKTNQQAGESKKPNIFLQPIDQLYETERYRNKSSRFLNLFNKTSDTDLNTINDHSFSTDDVLSENSINFLLSDLEQEETENVKPSKLSEVAVNDCSAKIAFFKYKQLKMFQILFGSNYFKELECDISKKCCASSSVKLLKKIFA
jgi:hypothetical protein